MKVRWRGLLALLLAVGLCGCSGSLLKPEYSLRAPAAAGLYRGVQQALQAAVGDDIVLQYPSVRGVQTAFTPQDLDGDGVEEILAFYQRRSEGMLTHVNVMRQTDDGWQTAQDLEPIGDVADVDFCDMNGDGLKEVCIGWVIYTSRTNQMCVYEVENGLLVQRATEAYTRYAVCDINSDGVDELALALLDPSRQASLLSFYKMEKGALTGLGTLSLDGSVVSYAALTVANVTSQTVGVYLDAYKATDTMITELVYFRGGRLYNPFASSQDGANVATLRYCSLNCTDINGDGVLEIPFSQPMPGYPQEDREPTHHFVYWRFFNGQISDAVALWWVNAGEGYTLSLDAAFQDTLTARYDDAAGCYDFFDYHNGEAHSLLFHLRRFSAGEFEEAAGDYRALAENERYVWAAAVEPAGEQTISFERLTEGFQLIAS